MRLPKKAIFALSKQIIGDEFVKEGNSHLIFQFFSDCLKKLKLVKNPAKKITLVKNNVTINFPLFQNETPFYSSYETVANDLISPLFSPDDADQILYESVYIFLVHIYHLYLATRG
jgi:hypothetical protein